MSKQRFTVLIMSMAVLVGFGAGCGAQEPTALKQVPALEQTSVAGPRQTISSDKADGELNSPGSNSVLPKSTDRPAGKCCFANCGDGWDGWHNLWWVDDSCNSNAAHFCASQGWSLINAEWFPC